MKKGFKYFLILLFKKFNLKKTELLIVLLAFILGFSFLFLPYQKYLINEDVRQVIFYMGQFQDKELFQNDLLTAYMKNYQPWGFSFVYYFFSFLIPDPLILTKIFSLVLLVIGSLYSYKLITLLTDKRIGLLGAATYMTNNLSAAALHRHFGLTLLPIFFYYLVKKSYKAASFLLILEALFYPIVFCLSFLTYFLSFISIKNKKIIVDKHKTKIKAFITAFSICAVIIGIRYLLFSDPTVGSLVNRNQAAKEYQSYTWGGRLTILPTPALTRTVINTVSFYRLFNLSYETLLPQGLKTINPKIVLFIFIIILILIIKKLKLPKETFLLFLAGIILFKLADFVWLKMFFPVRYIWRSMPFICYLISLVFIGRLINRIKKAKIKNLLVYSLIILLLGELFLNLNQLKEKTYFDFSSQNQLYQFIHSLPKDTMVAGHPDTVDNVPLFSQRKVFLTAEISNPFYDIYWDTIKKRTYSFFNAYYSEDMEVISKFCQENGIDYLVIDLNHFSKEFLDKRKVYFNPFNSYILKILENRENFALTDIPEKDKLFIENNTFVVSTDIFYEPLN